MTVSLGLPTVDELRTEVLRKYEEVAQPSGKEFHFHVGRRAIEHLGYDPALYQGFNDEAVESFAGVANPFVLGGIEPGAAVLDVGSGAGFDCLIAARRVGAPGRVIGVDISEPMLEKARHSAERLGLSNCEFRFGFAERLPVEKESIDVVISNGVINLCLDKLRVYRQIFRALRPGAATRSLISPRSRRSRNRLSGTSTSGAAELPAPCRWQDG